MCAYTLCFVIAILGLIHGGKEGMSKIKQHVENGVKFQPAVVCYLIRGNQVLLGLRKKVSLGLGKGLIAGIGGKVGDHPETANETAEEARDREALEEIVVAIKAARKRGKVRFIFPHKPQWNQEVEIYLVDEWEGEPAETESTQPMWFNINELPVSQMWPDNCYWLPKVLADETVNATFLCKEDGTIEEHIFEEGL